MTKVLFVCLGNICRSPMAEFVFKDIVKKRGLEQEFLIESKATSDYNEINEIGMHSDVKNILEEKRIPYQKHKSRQLKKEDYEKFDYILGMEAENIKNIFKIVGEDFQNKVFRLLDFTEKPKDIIDPWYYGNFDKTYEDIVMGCEAFLNFIEKQK